MQKKATRFGPVIIGVIVGLLAIAVGVIGYTRSPNRQWRQAERDNTVQLTDLGMVTGVRYSNLPHWQREAIARGAFTHLFGSRTDRHLMLRDGAGEYASFSPGIGFSPNPRRTASCLHATAVMIIPKHDILERCAETSPTVAAMLQRERDTGFLFLDPCVLDPVAETEPGARDLLSVIRFFGGP